MAKKTQAASNTGTSRVKPDGGALQIPAPNVPEREVVEKAEAKPEPKEPAAKVQCVVTSAHIIKSLAKSRLQNSLVRLKNLSRTNRDVAWLLSEYQNLSEKKS